MKNRIRRRSNKEENGNYRSRLLCLKSALAFDGKVLIGALPDDAGRFFSFVSEAFLR